MLAELYLRNYILIPELRLRFNKGFTVLTGETGAGKSIIVGALNLVFGIQSAGQIALDAEKETYVELTFLVEPAYLELKAYLEEIGASFPEGELVIAREFAPGGRSVSYLNGRKTNISILRDLYLLLVDFHFQRDQQKLLNGAYQLDLLDSFGKLGEAKAQYQEKLRSLNRMITELQKLENEDSRNEQLSELYAFQAEELRSASLTPDEDSALQQEFELLSHADEIVRHTGALHSKLYEEENSVYDVLSHARNQLDKYSAYSSQLAEINDKLGSCLELVGELSKELRTQQDGIHSDAARLESIHRRLDLLNHLKAKYKAASIEELLQYYRRIDEFLRSRDSNQEQIAALKQNIEVTLSDLIRAAGVLSEKRQKTAKVLAADIEKKVKLLAIGNARMEIKIDKIPDSEIVMTNYQKFFGESGQDRIEMLFSANLGSPLQPLREIVSGGELSRILLATKKSLAEILPKRTIILDEIDLGIGGKTAGALADFIHDLAQSHQVICITHLAKIAAAGESHYYIDKNVTKGKTLVNVEILDDDTRRREIARMLSGHITETSLKHANELLNK